MTTTTHPKAYAAALILILVSVVTVALLSFRGDFTSTDRVSVMSTRSGLLLGAGAKVKFRGLEIGRVTEVTPQDDQVRLTLAVDPARLRSIPGNARVSVVSTTVFGAKYVAFVDPPTTDGTHLRPGATINADDVTVEINTVFQNLTGVLKQIEPEKLNETLSVLSTAIGGDRGKQLGDSLDIYADLVGRLHRDLPAVRDDIDGISGAAKAYAPATPAIMATLRNLSTTAKTLTDEQRNFDLMLTNVTGLATTGTTVVNTNAQAASRALDLLRPTTALFQTYSPALNCLIDGMDILLQKGLPSLGGASPGIRLSVSFLQGVPLYGYPGNLPKVNAKGGPNCMGLPRIPVGTKAKYLVTDTGVNPFRGEPATSQWHTEDLMTMLLGRPKGVR
ncbi:MCE family protein [Gordonia sp. (in: high G+C Gram-positive bacteria)]|jgi:phospholipid/cholesterol/gamma-HCH transport system substrate-binding protein|uniref:MCE family protein n=1 Tax=Gordonia sp. (in: high G+C Gram-positive bacteria) TaxID=84139 RepID=UPI001D931050|nr:MCE family protein [Gordonia sp. (in: high G+C Gram-positive bacteria)]MCB1296534.1 MCE family protein [Gordonia sp. (in: high G+C Gram-positive bacteria)]HMS75524.1 MCE family protein [Gordonia sp. (in: high G+C Gram-positive bacteria)]HQV18047.1 MCE family protein [Gordonia sp. (in: high G+C Gram-positive bacteria)]